jgi:hypothetical protein
MGPRWPCAAPVGDWLCSGLAPDSLVAGHYLPLADNPGVAPESDQTRSLQSDQRTLQSPVSFQALRCSPQRAGPPRRACRQAEGLT